MRRLIASAFLTVAVAGCGRGEDQKQIRATLAASDRAWKAQDVTKGCALMTRDAQRRYGFCDPKVRQASAILTFAVREPAIRDVDVDGDTAVVRRERGAPTYMAKVRGKWLIDADDEQQVRATLDAYHRALEAQDYERACAHMTEAGRREHVGQAPNPHAKTCVEAFDLDAVATDEDGFQTVQGLVSVPALAEGTTVKVDGDVAEVHDMGKVLARLRKDDGRWRLDAG